MDGHVYAEQDALIRALRRIEGQTRGLQRMIEEGRDCTEVVHQLTAIRAAVDRVGHRLVAANLRACLADTKLPRDVAHDLEAGFRALTSLRG